MKFLADLHIHSHYSRATSRNLNPEHLDLWARKKGLTVIGTGDFTHPGWVAELQEKLVEAEEGLYQLEPGLRKGVDSQAPASCPGPTRFLLSGEISCIYKKGGKTRKVHHLILMPDMASVLTLNERLDRIGNITSDGRPILGLDSRDLLEIVLEASESAFFIPAHVWTPWFSLFGSKSGFDTLEECFEDLSGHIYALETGLSSDPPMNRLLSALDKYLLVSNSDAHSPGKLGREANLFDTDINYNQMVSAMKGGAGFLGTIEFFPEEGKYHLDGHRKCQARLEPEETKELEESCPICGKSVTVGVLHRVHDLADRDAPALSKDFHSLIPLTEVLSELLSCGPATKKVMTLYEELLLKLGPELKILLENPLVEIEEAGGPLLKEAIERMRISKVIRKGGYDGEYGIIRLFEDSEKELLAGQMALFSTPVKKTQKRSPTVGSPKKQAPKKKSKSKTAKSPALKDPILDPLNREQKRAVLHERSHLLVKAGPGTGKTMTVTHRIAYLIRQGLASPGEVLALTFTRKAAREMEQRISKLLTGSSLPYVSTFHGFCLEILRNKGEKVDLPPNFVLCSETDTKVLAGEILEKSGAGKGTVRRFLKVTPILKRLSILGPDQDLENHEFFSLFREHLQGLRNRGMLDLDDLEVEALRLLRQNPDIAGEYGRKFHWIFVDEYQDTNPVQVEILKAVVHAGAGKICVIGDPDQAIYGFRGAEVTHFHSFLVDFPGAEEIALTKNYRSPKEILEGAAALLGKAEPFQSKVTGKGLIALSSCRTDSEEAEMIVEQVERFMGGTSYFSLDSGRVSSHEGDLSLSFGDIGVLFRLNAQGDALEKAMDRAGIPFVRSGERPLIDRYPVNVLWRFFQVLHTPKNAFYAKAYASLLAETDKKTPEIPEGFYGEDPLPEFIDKAAKLHELDLSEDESLEAVGRMKKLAGNFKGNMKAFLDALTLERGIDHAILAGDRVALMSLHAAKGLEWPVVFITGCEDQLLPCTLFGIRDDEEERRLFYVGMTRARHRLVLSYATRRVLNGRVLNMNPSPFLKTIPEKLYSALDRRGWKPKKKPQKQLKLFND